MLPENAPERFSDRETLWNEVEAVEKRKDAQLAREVEFAIPREMSKAEGIELARDFVSAEFVDRGMIADLNVHWDIGADGQPKPHAHVMLTMREVGPDGFGQKVREWNEHGNVEQWRETIASGPRVRASGTFVRLSAPETLHDMGLTALTNRTAISALRSGQLALARTCLPGHKSNKGTTPAPKILTVSRNLRIPKPENFHEINDKSAFPAIIFIGIYRIICAIGCAGVN